MNINKEYKQISVNEFSGYHTDHDYLKGKVVDKVAFVNSENYDCQMFIITFTDKTFLAVGPDYDDREGYSNEPRLDNQWITAPQCINGGDYSLHSWVDSEGKLRFEDWIEALRSLGIWKFTDEDAKDIMEKKAKKEEDREYRNYLRLKAKFEKHENKE